jgi:hypothetical protein
MRDDNTQDGAEPSPASAGSQPVAWAVTIGPPNERSVYEAFAAHQKDEAESLALKCCFGDFSRPPPLAGLFFSPTLTDEERWAIAEAVGAYNDNDDDEECARIAAALHGLLKRLG